MSAGAMSSGRSRPSAGDRLKRSAMLVAALVGSGSGCSPSRPTAEVREGGPPPAVTPAATPAPLPTSRRDAPPRDAPATKGACPELPSVLEALHACFGDAPACTESQRHLLSGIKVVAETQPARPGGWRPGCATSASDLVGSRYCGVLSDARDADPFQKKIASVAQCLRKPAEEQARCVKGLPLREEIRWTGTGTCNPKEPGELIEPGIGSKPGAPEGCLAVHVSDFSDRWAWAMCVGMSSSGVLTLGFHAHVPLE
jgi:hypothetical protein